MYIYIRNRITKILPLTDMTWINGKNCYLFYAINLTTSSFPHQGLIISQEIIYWSSENSSSKFDKFILSIHMYSSDIKPCKWLIKSSFHVIRKSRAHW